MYSEEEYLLLSGIQHFYFCKRQWALIHLEQQWCENEGTMLGKILHEKADQPAIKEKRKDLIITRAIPVSSSTLGLSGVLDVVEFHQSEDGILIPGKKGYWTPTVVEYKKGKPKRDFRDVVQVVAQTMALEEDFKHNIQVGYLYYFKTNEKRKIEITNELRLKVMELSDEMHRIYRSKTIPKAEFHKNCSLCSLVDICMPRTTKRKKSIENYLYGD